MGIEPSEKPLRKPARRPEKHPFRGGSQSATASRESKKTEPLKQDPGNEVLFEGLDFSSPSNRTPKTRSCLRGSIFVPLKQGPDLTDTSSLSGGGQTSILTVFWIRLDFWKSQKKRGAPAGHLKVWKSRIPTVFGGLFRLARSPTRSL